MEAALPFAIQNLLPVLFNMKVKNYFFSTLIGLFPMVFIFVQLDLELKKLLKIILIQVFFSMIQNKEIFLPIIGFFAI